MSSAFYEDHVNLLYSETKRPEVYENVSDTKQSISYLWESYGNKNNPVLQTKWGKKPKRKELARI
jgi:hypothetical protein